MMMFVKHPNVNVHKLFWILQISALWFWSCELTVFWSRAL